MTSVAGPSWVAGGALLSSPPDTAGVPQYRYTLDRWWDVFQPFVLWVLLNPSRADATAPDPTIRRCIERTKALGPYGGLRVVNLFAWRSPNPDELKPLGFERAVGNPHTDEFIRAATTAAAVTIVGWGRAAGVPTEWVDSRERVMWDLLDNPQCLGLTNDRPRHPKPQNPLQLPLDAPLQSWPGPRSR